MVYTPIQPIRILHQPVEDTFFRLHYNRTEQTLTCSHAAVTGGSTSLFLCGLPRDERMGLISKQAFFERIQSSFEGLNGTTASYCGAIFDSIQNRLSLFCDPYANQILYWYRDHQQVLASNHLDWLVRECGRKLHIDWQTWNEVLCLHFVSGYHTYFEEIKAVNLHQIVHFDLTTCTPNLEEKQWFLKYDMPQKTGERKYQDIASLFQEGISKLVFHQPDLTLALSGGMDSRMILAGLKKANAKVRTYTTDTDVGNGDEEINARRVAAAYGIPNTFVDLPMDWYERTVDRYYSLSSFESWYHVWFQGFIDHLPDLGSQPFLTGNDGDGYLRVSHVPRTVDDMDQMFGAFERNNHADVFLPGFTREIQEGARQRFRQEYSKYAGVPGSISFFRLQSRSRRNIHWMARQATTRFEFLSGFQYPPFVEYIFGLKNEDLFDPNLQIEIMRALDPQTLTIPSSHPALRDKIYQAQIRKYNPNTIEKFRELLEGSHLIQDLNLLDRHKTRAFFSRMENLDLLLLPRFTLLQPVYMLARWLETYADVLIQDRYISQDSTRAAIVEQGTKTATDITGIISLFLPRLKEWITRTPQGVRIRDHYESEYDENYAPATGAVILAHALKHNLDVESDFEIYLTRSAQMLNQITWHKPFQLLFILHYLCLSILILPSEKQAGVLDKVRKDIENFVDQCSVLNTNCAALKLANEVFLNALAIRAVDTERIHNLLTHIETARSPYGFINDQVEESDEGRLIQGNDMPVAYHAFIVFICACALRYGKWPDELGSEQRQVEKIVTSGLDWLTRADTSDGSFAMAGRGKYHLFTRGVRCALHAYRGDREALESSLQDWLNYQHSDGTYNLTLNHLPHAVRTGQNHYARVNMYNSLALAALAIAQDFLDSPATIPTKSSRPAKVDKLEIDHNSGYAFYRSHNHFIAINLPSRQSEYGCLAMEGFHLRLGGEATILAESCPNFNRPINITLLDNGVFEGWLARAEDGKWHYPVFQEVHARSLGQNGIQLSGENDIFKCEKKYQLSQDGMEISYRLTPKTGIDKLIYAVPICAADGHHEARIHPVSPQTINGVFRNRLYQMVCSKAKNHTYLLDRCLKSVSGISTRLQYTLLETSQAAYHTFEWDFRLIDHGIISDATPLNQPLQIEDPLSSILGARLSYPKPLRVGDPVEIITDAKGDHLEYAWYILEKQTSGNRKIFVQMYIKENKLVWKPEYSGRFVIMLFIRDASRVVKSIIWPEVLEVIS